MKRVKIMLTAITVLAAVGGALALKARTFGSTSYCTSSNPNAQFCTISTPTREVLEGNTLAYTIVPNGFVCSTNTRCSKQGGGLQQ